ncbi:MAG: hypothetical protein PHV13_01805 [Candidatus ainarchaeum sp.]|nr:hypothetical protein [Candidatus ainarchaeum sp.]
MAKEMGKGMTCGCGTCMGRVCGSITGLLVLVSGLAFVASAQVAALINAQDVMIAGAALALAGLSLLIHALGLCPLCKGK